MESHMKTALYTHESSVRHDTGLSHPESMDRIKTLLELFEAEPFSSIEQRPVTGATEEQILLAHPYHYLEHIRASLPDHGHHQIDSDTVISSGSWDAALHAAGAVCSAVDDIAAGQTDRAFCAIRPPGHHAEPAASMGFCLFNNIFIGARHAQVTHGFPKVAIVDFDVHHGNGTDTMTRNHDGSIFFISTHQYPLWPMTGLEEDNDECVMNLTLPPESGSENFRTIYEKKVFPALEKFAPDLLMVSAGFDAHKDDPLAQINLVEEDFEWVTSKLVKIADKFAQGRIVSVLEGGYNLDALKASVAAHLRALS